MRIEDMDKYYQKEYEAAKKRGASKGFLADMEFLMQFDGLHDAIHKYQKDAMDMFELVQTPDQNGKIMTEKEALDLCCYKAVANALHFIRTKQPPRGAGE